MDLSPQQERARDGVRSWLARGRSAGVFRLFGFAGTGKTTIAKALADEVAGRVMFGSFTGKAASVLRRKGCQSATTIHRMIYLPKEKSKARFLELERKAEEHEKAGDTATAARVRAEALKERENLKRPSFGLNPDSEVKSAALVVIDEVSMVGSRMGTDLESFGTPLLVLGDPAQLPPVADGGHFIKGEPDFMLDEIHRQAADSPIIRMATAVRKGGDLRHGDYGEGCRVIPRGTLKIEDVLKFDQVLVGRNATRSTLNTRFREALGRRSHLPEPGDKLVCLRNDHEIGLLNGSQWLVDCSTVVDDSRVIFSLREVDGDARLECEAHRHYFEGREKELGPWDVREAQCFDYGFALTCHKAQGSQWDNVLVIDESGVFRADAAKWLYTAVTRAAKTVTVVN